MSVASPSPSAPPTGAAGSLIARLGMSLIPAEGAWFALRHVSTDRIPPEALPGRYAGGGPRPMGNAILALITRRDFSALHRLRSDETWHFHGGDPAELLLLHPDGRAETVDFGADPLAGHNPQVTVPAGVWMGARPSRAANDAYSFFGCTLAPGFDYSDYESGWRDELTAAYPSAAEQIAALTREEFASRPTRPEHPPAPVAAIEARVIADNGAPEIPLAPGMSLRELVGRSGAARAEAVSLARFRLDPGCSSGSSRYLGGYEYFIVLSGRGRATLDASDHPVEPGAVVVIPRGLPHAMIAAPDSPLEFLAVLAPAFNPAHFLPESPPVA